jgi:hypothetical protein
MLNFLKNDVGLNMLAKYHNPSIAHTHTHLATSVPTIANQASSPQVQISTATYAETLAEQLVFVTTTAF